MVVLDHVVDEIEVRVRVRKRHDSRQQLRQQNPVGVTARESSLQHTHVHTTVVLAAAHDLWSHPLKRSLRAVEAALVLGSVHLVHECERGG